MADVSGRLELQPEPIRFLAFETSMAHYIMRSVSRWMPPKSGELGLIADFRIAAASLHVAIDTTFYDLCGHLPPNCGLWRSPAHFGFERHTDLFLGELPLNP
jgi:hypothetical protein